jgi:hypothetical protein
LIADCNGTALDNAIEGASSMLSLPPPCGMLQWKLCNSLPTMNGSMTMASDMPGQDLLPYPNGIYLK